MEPPSAPPAPALSASATPGPALAGVEWRVAPGLTPYADALAEMTARVAAIAAGDAAEQVLLVEHPPTYTAGTSADPAELLTPDRFPVFATGRGGRYTYHGPGQRTGYVMVDLKARGRDVRRFVHALEGWLIDTLGDFGIAARRVDGRIGIWVDDRDGREAKIGAIGVRVSRWVTWHGFAVNIAPDLGHFGGIVPCGIADHPVTSIAALGRPVTMDEFDKALRARFEWFLSGLSGVRDTA